MKSIGGVQTIVDILNQVDRTLKTHYRSYGKRRSRTCRKDQRIHVCILKDIITLDDVSIQRVLRRSGETKELALAPKGLFRKKLQKLYLEINPKRAATSLKEDIEFLGPVRLMDVEKSQQRIVNIIRRLDGRLEEIVISRGGEDAIIVFNVVIKTLTLLKKEKKKQIITKYEPPVKKTKEIKENKRRLKKIKM